MAIHIGKWYMKSTTPIGEESSNAKVFNLCTKDELENEDCGYVMKVGIIEYPDKNKEVEMQTACAKKDLCLPVEDSWISGDKQIIITRLARETLLNYINYETDDTIIINKIKNALFLIKELHLSGIVHGDAHLNNFMFTQDNQLKFIDLGSSVFLKDEYSDNFFTNYLDQVIYDYDLFGKNVGYIPKTITQLLSELINEHITQKLKRKLLKYSNVNVPLKILQDVESDIVEKFIKNVNI